MAFSDFNTDYRKRLEQHKQKGAKSSLSIHQVARIMDKVNSKQRITSEKENILVNLRVCLN